jgi:hypothetical protein
MRFSLVTLLAAMASVAAAQQCSICGSVTAAGLGLLTLGTCTGGTVCVSTTTAGAGGLLSATVGVSLIYKGENYG